MFKLVRHVLLEAWCQKHEKEMQMVGDWMGWMMQLQDNAIFKHLHSGSIFYTRAFVNVFYFTTHYTRTALPAEWGRCSIVEHSNSSSG